MHIRNERISRRSFCALAVAALAIASAGCGLAAPRVPPPYVAIQAIDEVRLWARAAGRIAVEDGCVWLRSADDKRYLPVWPPGSTLTSVGGLDGIEVHGITVPIGAHVALGGGFERQAIVDALVAEPLPEGCRGGAYWVVSSVAEIDGIPVPSR